MLKPLALNDNSQIALIAPAGPVTKLQLKTAQENLSKMGFQSTFTESVLFKKGYLAGDDKHRLDDLNKAFEDEKVDAILCIRGGYGCARVLEQIDYDLIKKNPKLIIGYSDITALLNAIWQKTGLVTMHGIVGTSAFTTYTQQQFKGMLMGTLNNRIFTNKKNEIQVITSGSAEGRLIGGNLAIICSLMGTPFEPDFSDKIVFLEDVGEAPYRIDRMLTQLLLSGKLKQAKGVILGKFSACDIDNDSITNENSLSLNEVFFDRLGQLGIPVMAGFSFGHVKNQALFPIGIKAKMDTNNCYIELLEHVFT